MEWLHSVRCARTAAADASSLCIFADKQVWELLLAANQVELCLLIECGPALGTMFECWECRLTISVLKMPREAAWGAVRFVVIISAPHHLARSSQAGLCSTTTWRFLSELGTCGFLNEKYFLKYSISHFLLEAGRFSGPCQKEGYFSRSSWALVALYWKQPF